MQYNIWIVKKKKEILKFTNNADYRTADLWGLLLRFMVTTF